MPHSAILAVMGYVYPIKNATTPTQERSETETDKTSSSGVQRPVSVYKKPVFWVAGALVGGTALLLLPKRKRSVQ